MDELKRTAVNLVISIIILLSSLHFILPTAVDTSEDPEIQCKTFSVKTDTETPPGAREDLGPIDMVLNDTMTISGDNRCGEIHLRDGASFNVENAVLVVAGAITISDDALFNIVDSTITIESPDLPRNVSLMNLSGNGEIHIENSKVNINPFPFDPMSHEDREAWLIEHGSYVPFILSDDNSKVTITGRSVFSVRLPSKVIPEYIQEQRYITAGTILLAGQSSWSVSNSQLDAYLHTYVCEENDTHLTRWFWLSLQGDSYFKMDHSTATLKECTPHEKTLLKPTQGIMEILDSTVTGEVLIETVSDVRIINSTIQLPDIDGIDEKINFPLIIYDHSSVYLKDNVIDGNMGVGWSSAIQGYGKAASTAFLEGCTIKGNMTAYTNAEISLTDTTVGSGGITISDNVVLNLVDSALPRIAVWMGHHQVLWNISEDVTVSLEDSSVGELLVLPKVAPLYPPDIIEDAKKIPINMTVSLCDSVIEKLNLSSNASLKLELKDESKIEDFINSDRGNFNMTVMNATIPKPNTQNVTLHVKKILDITVTLNHDPLKDVEVEIIYEGQEVISGYTDENGEFSRLVYYQHIADSETKTWDHYYKIELKFFNFEKSKNLLLEDSLWVYSVDHNWNDASGPVIKDITHSPDTWNALKPVSIFARAEDEGVGIVQNMKVMYKVDKGKWNYIQMYELGENKYECKIPRQGFGSELEYRIIATDAVGNKRYSPKRMYTVGDEETTTLLVILIAPIVVIGIVAVFKWRRRKKIIGYMKRGKKKWKRSAY